VEQTTFHILNPVGRSSKSPLGFASTVNFRLGSRRLPWANYCSLQDLYVFWNWGLLFYESKGVTTTGNSLTAGKCFWCLTLTHSFASISLKESLHWLWGIPLNPVNLFSFEISGTVSFSVDPHARSLDASINWKLLNHNPSYSSRRQRESKTS
jgi:hypothetical protein